MARKTKIEVTVEMRPRLTQLLSPKLYARAAREMLDDISTKVATRAGQEAPGSRLADKVKHKVARREPPHSAVIRVAKSGIGKRARFVHGDLRGKGLGRTRAHRPPPTPELAKWARAHGISLGAVIAGIAARGAEQTPFLHIASEAHKGAPAAAVAKGVRMVQEEWRRGR